MNVIVVVGMIGEFVILNVSEYCVVIKFVVEWVGGKIFVIVGIGVNFISEVIEFIEVVKFVGVDVCLLVVLYYNKLI